MKNYAALCQTVEDMEDKRIPYRARHLEYLRKLKSDGKVLIAGAFIDPIDMSMIVYRAADETEAWRYIEGDPYFSANLWTKVALREMAIPDGLGVE